MQPGGRKPPWTDPSALCRALMTATTESPTLADTRPEDLDYLPANGLDNDHVAVHGTGAVLRIPRWPVPGLDPAAALALRAERFRRAAPCGHVPALLAVLPPSGCLPQGALLVEAVVGPPASVPGDMDAVADALAALHGLPLPAAPSRPPLPQMADPAAGLIGLIERQGAALPAAGAAASVQRLVAAETERARTWLALMEGTAQPVSLVGTDTHPGNFLMADDGRAVLVDLDKTLYGAPAVDLAHAGLATSVFWATGQWDALDDGARRAFHRRYLAALPPALATAVRPWLAPLCRLTWLRTTTWAAVWRSERLPALRTAPGLEDLVARADARTAAILDAEAVARLSATVPDFDGDLAR